MSHKIPRSQVPVTRQADLNRVCKMFGLILLSFELTFVVSEHPIHSDAGIRLPYSGKDHKTNGVEFNPNPEDTYVKGDKIQNMEQEISELKAMFQAKGQEMEKEVEKMRTKMFYQQEKMENMEKEINNLKETVSSQSHMSPVKRICVFEHSVMTNFNCACPAIQRGQGSGFLSEGSSWLTACMSEQRRFWRDCADAQARLNLRCSHMR